VQKKEGNNKASRCARAQWGCCCFFRYQMQIKRSPDYRSAHFIKIYCTARDATRSFTAGREKICSIGKMSLLYEIQPNSLFVIFVFFFKYKKNYSAKN